MSTKPDSDYALSQQIKTEARSLPDFIEWAVAALIAEGGEIVWRCLSSRNPCTEDSRKTTPWPAHEKCGPRLVFPIPVESAEAKETPR